MKRLGRIGKTVGMHPSMCWRGNSNNCCPHSTAHIQDCSECSWSCRPQKRCLVHSAGRSCGWRPSTCPQSTRHTRRTPPAIPTPARRWRTPPRGALSRCRRDRRGTPRTRVWGSSSPQSSSGNRAGSSSRCKGGTYRQGRGSTPTALPCPGKIRVGTPGRTGWPAMGRRIPWGRARMTCGDPHWFHRSCTRSKSSPRSFRSSRRGRGCRALPARRNARGGTSSRSCSLRPRARPSTWGTPGNRWR
eukprot:1942-Hanusia_phi.AAC.7